MSDCQHPDTRLQDGAWLCTSCGTPVSARDELLQALADYERYYTPDDAEAMVDAYAREMAERQHRKTASLVELLRDIDLTQKRTDEYGGREIAWYYARDSIEDAMGIERGALDTGDYDPEQDDEEDEA